ncbi:MAG: primosomal protein N' [Acidobacteriota bacterium]|nr:primosomal protein N' [Acidobacteriota bacterium]
MNRRSASTSDATRDNAADGQSAAGPLYAEVALPLRLAQTFTYRLPLALREDARVGARLLVPFGRTLTTAYVVALHDALDPALGLDDAEIKEAEELLDAEPLLTPEVLEVTRWISDYYAAPWGEVLKAALPAGLNATVEQVVTITQEGRDELARLPSHRTITARAQALRLAALDGSTTMREAARELGQARAAKAVRELARRGWVTVSHRARSAQARAKRRKAVRLLPPGEDAGNEGQDVSGAREDRVSLDKNGARALTEVQRNVVETLIAGGGEMLFAELLEAAHASASTIQSLEKRRVVEVFVREVRRDPLAGASLPKRDEFRLTEAQDVALREINEAQGTGKYAAFLLHGVTGSGKTEIYIRAMRAAIERGRTAMMLVPEIALTPVFSRRLRAHFGQRVAIFHSSLTTGERFDEWSRLKRGEARVVIGTRSAVFAPVRNLGLIVVDEEHEASYRQQESPYYNGRDTAVVRAHKERAVVVLGSATPSLESFQNARAGKYRYLRLPKRIADRPMARAEILDMREVFRAGGRAEVFSPELLAAIEETHARGEQSIVLLNRRGYSSFVLCRSCGERINCANCDVTLTYHRGERSLVCHYCNLRERVPDACPACRGQFLYFIGEGTEQIEEILRARFPALRIARLDRDTTARRSTYEQAVLSFAAGELDMLVGTQMIAKGHDFPNVTLVGVVSVDAGLALPDFRAAERTFQLITQVAGRAGRGRLPGRVLIQTYHPQHYALRHACAQDYEGFFDEEINYRRNLSYPPFVALASLLVHGDDLTRVQATAAEVRRALDRHNPERHVRLLGPAPAPLARLRGEHRVQILLKSRSRPRLRELIQLALTDAANTPGCDAASVNVEIDPVSLM